MSGFPDEWLDAIRRAMREEIRAELAAAAAPVEAGEWIDAKGAAALLGVHARTVINLAKPDATTKIAVLPSTRIGRRLLRFRRADVLALLERKAG